MPNISRSNGNRIMKFGQKHITWETSFLKKLYIKCGEGTSPKSFSEKSKLSTSFDLRICKFVWKFVLFDFIVCSSQGCNISKLKCRPLAFTLYKACLKNKKRSGNSLPVSFLHEFWIKHLRLILLTDPTFFVWLPLLLENFGNMYIVIVCFSGCGVINFEINLSFLIEPCPLFD